MDDNFLVLTFDDIWEQLYLLYEKITFSGFKIDIIIGITRGGLLVARILSDLMENKNIYTIGVGFYQGISETIKKPILLQKLDYDLSGKKVLVVDDVADTGKSLSFILKYLRKKNPLEVRVATLHYKPHSSFKPDYYINETSSWIVYPWEYTEFSRLYSNKLIEEKKSINEIRNLLGSLSIPKKVIDLIFLNKK